MEVKTLTKNIVENKLRSGQVFLERIENNLKIRQYENFQEDCWDVEELKDLYIDTDDYFNQSLVNSLNKSFRGEILRIVISNTETVEKIKEIKCLSLKELILFIRGKDILFLPKDLLLGFKNITIFSITDYYGCKMSFPILEKGIIDDLNELVEIEFTCVLIDKDCFLNNKKLKRISLYDCKCDDKPEVAHLLLECFKNVDRNLEHLRMACTLLYNVLSASNT